MAAERVTGPWLSREPETASRGLDYLLDCVRQEECVRDLRFSGLAAGEESLRLLAAAQCRFVCGHGVSVLRFFQLRFQRQLF